VAWGDVPTWLLVLVSLLALGAAVLAYRKQSQEVRDQAEQLRLQSEQLADQKQVNDEQVRLMVLQERELRAVQDERERQAAERREAQARQIAAWFGGEIMPPLDIPDQDWGAHIRNASLLPVFDIRVFFHFVQTRDGGIVDARGLSWYPVDRGGPAEPVRVIAPGQRRFVRIPDAIKNMVDRCDAQTYVVAIHFGCGSSEVMQCGAF
jgi:cbb3-type cytochrome oxidase subunit 3